VICLGIAGAIRLSPVARATEATPTTRDATVKQKTSATTGEAAEALVRAAGQFGPR